MSKVIKILATKSLGKNPFDGVGNATISIFSRIDSEKIIFFTATPIDFLDKGSIRHFVIKGNGLVQIFEKIIFLIKIKPDFIWGIANNWEILFLFFKHKKTRYIINLHTVLLKKSGMWRVKTPWFFRKFLFARADKIICASEFIAQSAKKYFPKKNIVTILNGVDVDFFNPGKRNLQYIQKKFNIDVTKPIISFVGILHPRKRPDFFIELAKNYPNANFVMIGRQIEEYGYLSKADELKNFIWIERISRDDIAVLLASSAILAIPSLNEPGAAVIGEAMSSGAIVIAADSGGNGEFINHKEDGFLVPVNKDEKVIYLKLIDRILNNISLQQELSQKARMTAINKLSFKNISALYENEIIHYYEKKIN